MKSAAAIVLIAGAGQLGSRYLQGLAKCRLPLMIYVQDISATSLVLAEQRWDEVHGLETRHVVSFHTTFDTLPRQCDIAIVVTTADVRPKVIAEIADYSTVRFWVLEKVLAQSESGLDEIMEHVGIGSRAWVNTMRRILPLHQQLKLQLSLKPPLVLKVGGGKWGLACNAVHFLDLLAWWTGETLQEVNTDLLSKRWFEGKRQGNWEVLGTLGAKFSGGSQAFLSAGEGEACYSLTVSDHYRSCNINEEEGLASCSDGIEILSSRLPYQSELSAALVESILESCGCGLPTLEESVAIHRVFLRGMIEHWKQTVDPDAICVPIT
jgi:hypothetical protein